MTLCCQQLHINLYYDLDHTRCFAEQLLPAETVILLEWRCIIADPLCLQDRQILRVCLEG